MSFSWLWSFFAGLDPARLEAMAAEPPWPPGVGKSQRAAAIGLALVENGYRVLFSRATDLVQKLQGRAENSL